MRCNQIGLSKVRALSLLFPLKGNGVVADKASAKHIDNWGSVRRSQKTILGPAGAKKHIRLIHT